MRHSVQCSSVTTDFPHGQIVLLRRNRQVSAILMISYQECVPLTVNTDDHMTQVLSGFIPTSMLYFLEGSYCAQLTLKNCRTLMHLQEDRGDTQIFAVLQRSLFYLFIYLFISMQAHRYRFHSLHYNSMLHDTLCCSNYFIFGQQQLFSLVPVIL